MRQTCPVVPDLPDRRCKNVPNMLEASCLCVCMSYTIDNLLTLMLCVCVVAFEVIDDDIGMKRESNCVVCVCV